MCPTCDEVVQIVIPTGALGNMTCKNTCTCTYLHYSSVYWPVVNIKKSNRFVTTQRLFFYWTCHEIFLIWTVINGCLIYSAGIIAREMGVQLEFVCTVTQNDVVARTIQTGNYAIADYVVKTFANAMDIQVSMFNKKPIHYKNR